MKRSLLAILLLCSIAVTAEAREQLRLAVSSSTLDAVGAVAARFARNTGHPDPAVEVTGSALGFDLFCAGVGFEHVDVVTVSRPMSAGEYAKCSKNGVTSVTEIEIGRDALVVVSGVGRQPLPLSRAALHAALASELAQGGELKRNKALHWSDVDPRLPKQPIHVIGPSARSSQMADFLDLVMAGGCSPTPGLEGAERELRCRALRQDGPYQEGPKNASHVLEQLRANPDAIAILPYTFYASHRDDLTAHPIDGILPTEEHITAGRYLLIEPVRVYVKNQHMGRLPGLQQLTYEFASERAISPTGYVAATGVVPLDDIGRNRARDMALSLQPWRPAP
jgi:phosphate transport system substrate-binding protein